MKANELMIGDWVIGGSGEPFKIGIIDPDFLYWNEVQPIPLTSEILEKNGFEKDEKLEGMYNWNWGIGNNCVSYDKETGIVRIFHVFGHLVFVLPLSYVHELQHALRLCGIKKEIIL